MLGRCTVLQKVTRYSNALLASTAVQYRRNISAVPQSKSLFYFLLTQNGGVQPVVCGLLSISLRRPAANRLFLSLKTTVAKTGRHGKIHSRFLADLKWTGCPVRLIHYLDSGSDGRHFEFRFWVIIWASINILHQIWYSNGKSTT